MSEEKFMRRALQLALKGESWTNPNPLVGAVLVKNNKIIGEGFHAKFGENHAEINAIDQAGKDAAGSTLFVNLEPCSSHGNTPPCTDAIIKAGIEKVVYASSDPSQDVSSKILTAAGIKVVSGVLKTEADFLNRKFLYFIQNNTTYVTIKFAASLDGKLASKTFDSKWITNEKARAYARSLRAENQAVLVGSNTVLHDDPHLGARDKSKKDPLRIILDTELKIPADAKIYRDTNVLVFAVKNANEKQAGILQSKGISVHKFNSDKIKIKDVLNYLAGQKVISILVEGGGETIGSFIDNKAVSEVYGFYAPIIIGGKEAKSISGGGFDTVKNSLKIKNSEFKNFDDNFMVHGLI